jgi:hypothetical protein
VTQFAHCACFNLADALTSEIEVFAHFFKRALFSNTIETKT